MKSTPKIVGLTGGIGSGKTTVANFFKDIGIPIYIADDEAKALMSRRADISTIIRRQERVCGRSRPCWVRAILTLRREAKSKQKQKRSN